MLDTEAGLPDDELGQAPAGEANWVERLTDAELAAALMRARAATRRRITRVARPKPASA